jgi:hypothetical protein
MNAAELVDGPGPEWRRELAAELADDLAALPPLEPPAPKRRRAPGGRNRTLTLVLTICAAGRGVMAQSGVPVVCGREPGHWGPHRDIEYTLTWTGDGNDA